DQFKEPIRKLAHASFSIIEPLHKIVRAFFKPKGMLDDIRDYHKAVGVQESDVDQLEWDLTVDLYNSSLDLASKHHLKKALDRIVHVSDRAEDSADALELVALKSVL
ncbi:MAG: DUF47 family protein, partial [Akkermansiaceae bacterium]|nr:DUF47 family protein [Akkermansiaceae bacterium]